MSKIMYCAECEERVLVEEPVEGHTKLVDMRTWQEPDAEDGVTWCDGPFYDSEPPTNGPDWDLQDEPSQEELVLMNLAAEELMQDLGV